MVNQREILVVLEALLVIMDLVVEEEQVVLEEIILLVALMAAGPLVGQEFKLLLPDQHLQQLVLGH
jgi:hypothetical protein